MGALRELISEVISLPEPFTVSEGEANSKTLYITYQLPYALINLIFQFIDCVVLPIWTIKIINSDQSGYHFLALLGTIIILLASVFSLSQFIYYFIKPTNRYVNFKSRFLGETALGVILSAVFKIKINHYI